MPRLLNRNEFCMHAPLRIVRRMVPRIIIATLWYITSEFFNKEIKTR